MERKEGRKEGEGGRGVKERGEEEEERSEGKMEEERGGGGYSS